MTFGIILAGGRGERFWPLSRARRAKQFLPIVGGRTLLALSAERLRPLLDDARLLVITGRDQAELVAESLPSLPAARIVAEPIGRNTAPAVAYGALRAIRQDPDAVIVVIPSDAWVGDDTAYRDALETAIRAASAADVLVTVGVVPSRPETGYGYLETGDALPGAPGVFRVRRFVEKPDAARAMEYLAGGRHLWNCGIFVMRAAAYLAAVERHLEPLAELVRALDAAGCERPGSIAAYYAAAPAISIDYGVMEKSDAVVTVRAAFPWDDLGSWEALGRVLPAAADDVRARGATLVLDSPGSIVYSEEGITAVLGAPDLIVVRVADATLVVPRRRAQEVRRIVEALSQRDDLEKYL